MVNVDEKASCLELIKTVSTGLELYDRVRDETVAQSIFSLNESLIADVAELYGLESSIKEELKEKQKDDHERRMKIDQLEQQMMHKASIEEFKKHVSHVCKEINSRWNEEGFKGSYQTKLTQYGTVYVTLSLDLLEEPWDLEEEDESEELDPKYKKAFQQKELEIDEEGEYIFIKDNDANKDILTNVMKKRFPGIHILEWKHIKNNGVFYLREIRASLSNLMFLEEKR